jgi:hypothetical protein
MGTPEAVMSLRSETLGSSNLDTGVNPLNASCTDLE